jgi:transcriptional regulator GlxA family with amidase domain
VCVSERRALVTLDHDFGHVLRFPPESSRGGVGRKAPSCGRVCSVCVGSFLLAEAGLLEGRRAATHWLHAPLLAARHPNVEVEPDAIFVRDGDVWTSAGVTTGIDLALALIEQDAGREVAMNVARILWST